MDSGSNFGTGEQSSISRQVHCIHLLVKGIYPPLLPEASSKSQNSLGPVTAVDNQSRITKTEFKSSAAL